MIRFLLAALMCCLYMHALSMGFKIGRRVHVENKIVHIVVTGQGILKMAIVLGCGIFTAFTVRL